MADFILDIDTKFLDRLEKAEESLEELVKTTNKLSNSFGSLIDGNLSKFANVIDGISDKISGLSNINIGDLGIKTLEEKTANSASKIVDSITEISEAVAKVSQSPNGSVGMKEQMLVELDEYVNKLSVAKGKLRELSLEQIKSLKGVNTATSHGGFREGFGAEMQEATREVDSLMQKISELSKFISGIHGVSDESFGYMIQHMHDASTELIKLNSYFREQEKIASENVKANQQTKDNSDIARKEWEARQQVWEKGLEEYSKKEAEGIVNKYKSILGEIRQLNNDLLRLDDAEKKYGGDIDVSTQKSAYTTRLTQLNQERLEIERDHQDKISSIQAEETKRRMRDEVDAAERAARQVIEARKKAEKEEDKHRGTYQGAMEYSKNTKSIQEQIQAIKYLKQARESLKRTDFSSEKEYRKALNELTFEIDRQTDSIKDLKQEQERVPEISGQLKTAITNVFGFGAIKGYVNQLVRIRGEFELQHKSLQVLLRNKDEANKLWEQTVDLAVKSPYRVDQLVTATKQLAAYRIETEKLHSTTKMLADLSSGLGVEIDRLILAFGQVKAANFLRGTELRQFSEAGINILDELAEHYSALEERIVSVGDVFDRVSKRMVSFADVETVLQNMTGEGGQFYKMQEQQAETLRGMTMNLKDSIMLMYNDIGETTDGILKKTLTFFKHVVDNWRSYAKIITTVVGALAGYKTIITLSRILTAKWNPIAYIAASAFVKMGSTATWATARIRTLNRVISAIKLHPIMAIIAAIPALAGAIVGLNVSFDKNTDSIKSNSQILEENTMIAKRAASGIKELTEERSNLLKIENRSAEQEKRLNDITSARTRLLGELAIANTEYAKSLKLVGDDSEKMAKAIEEGNSKLDAQTVLAYKMSNIDWGDRAKIKNAETTKVATSSVFGGIYDGDLDLGAILTDSPTAIIENAINNSERDIEKAISSMFSNLTGYARAEQIKMIKGVLEGTPYGDIISDYIDAENFLSGTFSSLEGDVADIVTTFVNTTRGQILKENLISADEGIKNGAILELQNYFKKEFVSQSIPDSVQEEFKRAIAKSFGLEDDWFSKQIKKSLSAWQKGYNALLDTLTKDRKIPSLTPVDATTSIKDQVTLLKEFKEEQEAIIKQYEDQQKYKVMLPIHSKEDADNAKKNLDVVQQLLEALGQIAKSNKTDTRYTSLIKTVNDVYSAFDKLEEKFGDTIATEMLWRDYAESIDTAFRKVGKSANWVREQFGDLNSKESLKSALDWIAQNASTQEARLQAKTASAKISVDIEIEERDKAFDKLTKQVEDMFAGYELSIELDKLHVPKEFAENFFNIGTIDITKLRENIIGLKEEFINKGAEDEYQAYLKKLDELEAKSQQERLKKYQEFTKKAIGERAKIMLDSFYEFQEIDKAFELTNTMALNEGLIDESIKTELDSLGVTISDLLEKTDEDIMSDWFLTKDDISRLRDFNNELQRQRNIVKEGANKQTKIELDKEAWKQFQATDTFQMMMSDLETMSEAAIGKMIEQLEDYKAQWKDMPVSDIKQLVDVIDKLKDAQAAFSSPRGLKRILKGYLTEGVNVLDEDTGITAATYHFDSVKDAQNQLVDSDLKIQLLEEELALVEKIETLRNQGTTDDEIRLQLKEQDLHTEEAITSALRRSSNEVENDIDAQNNRKTAASKVVGVVEDIQASYKEQAERIKKVQTLTNSLFDGWEAINSLLKDDSMSSFLLDMSSSILDGVLNMIMLQGETFAATLAAEGLGAAINAAMGPIGWIVLAVQVLTKALKFAFEQHDKDIQEQIDGETKR